VGALVGLVLGFLNGVASALEQCIFLKSLFEVKTKEMQGLFTAMLAQFVAERAKIADQIRRCPMSPDCLKEAQDMYQRLTAAINRLGELVGMAISENKAATALDCRVVAANTGLIGGTLDTVLALPELIAALVAWDSSFIGAETALVNNLFAQAVLSRIRRLYNFYNDALATLKAWQDAIPGFIKRCGCVLIGDGQIRGDTRAPQPLPALPPPKGIIIAGLPIQPNPGGTAIGLTADATKLMIANAAIQGWTYNPNG
jgi:hypothetical protein